MVQVAGTQTKPFVTELKTEPNVYFVVTLNRNPNPYLNLFVKYVPAVHSQSVTK